MLVQDLRTGTKHYEENIARNYQLADLVFYFEVANPECFSDEVPTGSKPAYKRDIHQPHMYPTRRRAPFTWQTRSETIRSLDDSDLLLYTQLLLREDPVFINSERKSTYRVVKYITVAVTGGNTKLRRTLRASTADSDFQSDRVIRVPGNDWLYGHIVAMFVHTSCPGAIPKVVLKCRQWKPTSLRHPHLLRVTLTSDHFFTFADRIDVAYVWILPEEQLKQNERYLPLTSGLVVHMKGI
jgi:hypothetical protein